MGLSIGTTTGKVPSGTFARNCHWVFQSGAVSGTTPLFLAAHYLAFGCSRHGPLMSDFQCIISVWYEYG